MSTSEDVDVCVCVPMFTFHARRITARSPATWRPTVLEAQVTPTQECTPSVKWNDVIITSGFPKTTNVLILNSSPLISSLQKLKKWYFFLFSITWDAALLQRSPNNMLPFRTSYRVGIYVYFTCVRKIHTFCCRGSFPYMSVPMIKFANFIVSNICVLTEGFSPLVFSVWRYVNISNHDLGVVYFSLVVL